MVLTPSQALQQSVDAMGNPVSGIRGAYPSAELFRTFGVLVVET